MATKSTAAPATTGKDAAIDAVASLICDLCETAKAHTSRDQFALLESIAKLTESINKDGFTI